MITMKHIIYNMRLVIQKEEKRDDLWFEVIATWLLILNSGMVKESAKEREVENEGIMAM